MRFHTPLIFIFILIFSSCSDKNFYEKTDIWHMAVKVEPNVELILPESMDAGIKCSEYGSGCVSAYKLQVRMVQLIVVQFKTEESATAVAKRIEQYHVANWVFDDVRGEPVLEDFVKSAFGAIKAEKQLLIK
jgi:hypothetical protein